MKHFDGIKGYVVLYFLIFVILTMGTNVATSLLNKIGVNFTLISIFAVKAFIHIVAGFILTSRFSYNREPRSE